MFRGVKKVHPQQFDSNFNNNNNNNNREQSPNRSMNQEQMEVSSRKMGQTQMSANPSLIQLQAENQFIQMKQDYFNDIELIKDTIIVEKLGSTKTISQKKDELSQFQEIFQQFLNYFEKFSNLLYQIIQESELQGRNKAEHYESLVKDIDSIDIAFQELVITTSLRYLYKCCEIYKLDASKINLDFQIKRWSYNQKEILKHEYYGNSKSNRKYQKEHKKSFCQSLCGCFMSDNNNNQQQNESQKQDSDNRSNQRFNSQITNSNINNRLKSQLQQQQQQQQQTSQNI